MVVSSGRSADPPRTLRVSPLGPVAVHVADPTIETAALVAEQVNDNEWEALWTFDDERIRAVNRYIERKL